MRTLLEIVTDLEDSKMPTHEECYYALKVFRCMYTINTRQLRNEYLSETRAPEYIRQLRAENLLDNFHHALSMSPKEFLEGE